MSDSRPRDRRRARTPRGEPVRPAPHHRRRCSWSTGVILVILGLGASDAEIEKAAGMEHQPVRRRGDARLGGDLPAVGVHAPARRGAREADERRRTGRRSRTARVRGDAPAAPGATATTPAAVDAGRQQREHRAAEAAADHARAGGAGGLEARDGRLDLGHAGLVVVAQAGVRGVEQPAGRRRGRRRASAATVASTRAFSVSTWRARRSQRLRQPRRGLGVAPREVLDAERLAGRAALGAALVVAARGVAVLARRSRASRAASRRGRAGRADSRAWRSRSAARAPSRQHSEASWSSRPVSAPTQSFSTREQSLRELGAVGLLGAGARRAARGASAASSAAEEESPQPCGTSPVIGERARGATSTPAARSSATMPRTKARQPSRAPWRGGVERVRLAEVERVDAGSGRRRAARP